MRKEYGKALRELFARGMRDRFPQFAPARVSSRYVFPGERLFRWAPAESLHCWVILSPDGKGREAFYVEIGWSRLGRFPELGMRPSCADPRSADVAGERECVVRLRSLREPHDSGWELPDPALAATEGNASPEDVVRALQRSLLPISPSQADADVAPLVEDAFTRLRDDGVPFLERVAAHR